VGARFQSLDRKSPSESLHLAKWEQTYRDAKVTVLEEILDWSRDRPTWQRNALRHLLVNGELSDDDIRALTQICKGAHGPAESRLTDGSQPPKAELIAQRQISR